MKLVEMQKVQDDTVGLGETAAGSSGLVAKAYAALTLAFAGAGASYIFLAEDTLTVRALSEVLPAYSTSVRQVCRCACQYCICFAIRLLIYNHVQICTVIIF